MALGFSNNQGDFAAVGGSTEAVDAGAGLAIEMGGQRLDGVVLAAQQELGLVGRKAAITLTA